MTRFKDLVAAKGSGTPLDSLAPLPPDSIAAIRSTWPGVPADYIDFLTQLGAGTLGAQGGYALYGGFMHPDEVYDQLEPEIEALLILGDDFQGFNNAFAPESWEVVEIDPTDMTTRVVAPDFETFIRARIAELS